ncbi:MAG: sensor histidine kinase [Chloroflexi bacterium]|nr:sensor histidine kinase [Chloroflexota bacterium]
MNQPTNRRLRRLNLTQRFMLGSLVILIAGMLGIGWWVGQQIELGVVHRSAATTALYVDSFIAPNLQELAHSDRLEPEHLANLDQLLHATTLGQQISAFKIWNAEGRILYSVDPAQTGLVFPVQGGLAEAFSGTVAARISDLEEEENERERLEQSQLLEMYSPVRQTGTNQIIAVAEFYHSVEDLQREIQDAQIRSWLVVGVATLIMYVLLAGFVKRASDTIDRQQIALNDQISRLTELLSQNAELHDRVRRAAARTTALNERFLRRVGAELHDGPIQDISLALLRLDQPPAHANSVPAKTDNKQPTQPEIIQESLRHALQEVRGIAAGLSLPHLNDLTLAETLSRAVRAHERRTNTRVTLTYEQLPDVAPLPLKITLYRLVQEALTNAYRHADGKGQAVNVDFDGEELVVAISDQGPGFDTSHVTDWSQHLGLAGMRERVESLGGSFEVASVPGRGSTVQARLALHIIEGAFE